MTLRGLRERHGLTPSSLARELGLSERQIYRLEDGTTPLKRLHVLALTCIYSGLGQQQQRVLRMVETAAANTARKVTGHCDGRRKRRGRKKR